MTTHTEKINKKKNFLQPAKSENKTPGQQKEPFADSRKNNFVQKKIKNIIEADQINKNNVFQQKRAENSYTQTNSSIQKKSNEKILKYPDFNHQVNKNTAQLAAVFKFSNVTKKFQAKADQIVALLSSHPLILKFVGDRTCLITLKEQEVPADISDKGGFVDVNFASWYFEKYSIGYIMGMLSHEFGIHPIPENEIKGLDKTEGKLKGTEIDTGIKIKTGGGLFSKSKEQAYTVNTDRSKQHDHILGAVEGLERSKVYRDVAVEMAVAMSAKDKKIDHKEITNLIDCYLMDVSSILAGDDDRKKSAKNMGILSKIYNLYKTRLQAVLPKNSPILNLLPDDKNTFSIIGDFAEVGFKFLKASKESIKPGYSPYQPTALQTQYMQQHNLALQWIPPDGRCVFAALGQIIGLSAEDTIHFVLVKLANPSVQVTGIINNAGQQLQHVINCIKTGQWDDPNAGDIILEVSAAAINQKLSVLIKNGNKIDINGEGPIIIKVDDPLEHYHATK